MKLGFDISADDLVAFNDQSKKRYKRIYGNRHLIFIFLLAILLLLLLDIRNSQSLNIDKFASYIPLIVILFVFLAIRPRVIRKKMAKIYNNPANAPLMGYREIMLSSDGITVETKNSISNFKWDAVMGIDETEKYFFFHFSALTGIVVPKYKITESEAAELRALFAEYVKNDNKN